MAAGHVRVHLFISGRVQGVFYRVSCRDEGGRLGLSGWVRNLPDGRVEAVAEGNASKIEAFIAWCRRGPPDARVSDVEVRREEPKGERELFRITS